MRKHKTYSRKKIIKATNISDLIYNQVIKTTNLRQLCRDIGVSEYRVRQILNGESKIDYIRSKETNILWQIEYEFDYVVEAKPLYADADVLDTVHKFTSAYKCCKFLGISKSTYYARIKLQPIGEPCKKTVTDIFDREWQLTFLKEPKEKEEWRFIQNEDSGI